MEVDPNHNLLFLYPGMIDFFRHFKEKAQPENIDDKTFTKLFSRFRGITLLDTLGQPERNIEEIKKLHTGLEVLKTKAIGLDKMKQLLLEVIEENNKKTKSNYKKD